MFDPTHLIQSGGLILIAAMIFAESGMLVGLVFPGDTLLLTAGVFAAQGKLSLAAIIAVAAAAAIVGDNCGYQIGKSAGPRIFKKKDGLLFRHEYMEQSESFFKRHGAKTMLVAHFIPVVRTFVPVVAGAGKMNRAKFASFDAIGDIAWAVSVTLIGYWFGSKLPANLIDRYILLAIALAVLISFGPMVYHITKAYMQKRKTGQKL